MSVKDVFRKRFIINTAYFGLLLAIGYVFLKFLFPLVSPFLVAFIIAFLLRKPSVLISRHTKTPQKLVSFVLVIAFFAIVGSALAFAGVKIIGAITQLITMLPELYEGTVSPLIIALFDSLETAVAQIDPAVVQILNDSSSDFVSRVGESVTGLSLGILASVSNLAASLPGMLIKLLLMIISTFFIALDYDKMSAFLKKQVTGRTVVTFYLIRQYLVNTLLVVIRSYLIIMTITFTELSIGLSIIGVENALLIALMIAVFDILPILGTGGVMIPWVVITMFQGNTQLGLSLLAVYAIVTVVRNILEPKIVGGQLGLHPVVALMSMFVGASLLGAVGLFGFPIGLSLLKYLNDQGFSVSNNAQHDK